VMVVRDGFDGGTVQRTEFFWEVSWCKDWD
jgi:hypothetical protein